ncbi:MAG: hypothetical protein LLF94_10335 [Chlamydiales bacterium]|nr:hypothetical protein [Chlamydiales bacterium]
MTFCSIPSVRGTVVGCTAVLIGYATQTGLEVTASSIVETYGRCQATLNATMNVTNTTCSVLLDSFNSYKTGSFAVNIAVGVIALGSFIYVGLKSRSIQQLNVN